MDETEKRTSRGRFLRQVGVTLAAAVGAGKLASAAFALGGNCCSSSGDPHNCGSCGTGRQYCFCDCTAAGTPSYCYQAASGCLAVGHCTPCPC